MSDPAADVFALLDELRAIARTGLHFSSDPFDRERYDRLLELASREYAERSSLDATAIRARFDSEIGYVTARVGVDAAVFDDRDRILLTHRADDDKWGLIAGWVDRMVKPTPERPKPDPILWGLFPGALFLLLGVVAFALTPYALAPAKW